VGKNFAVLDIFFMGLSHEKYIKNGIILTHLRFNLKVLPGYLIDVSV
jgi:hypothetical protein